MKTIPLENNPLYISYSGIFLKGFQIKGGEKFTKKEVFCYNFCATKYILGIKNLAYIY